MKTIKDISGGSLTSGEHFTEADVKLMQKFIAESKKKRKKRIRGRKKV